MKIGDTIIITETDPCVYYKVGEIGRLSDYDNGHWLVYFFNRPNTESPAMWILKSYNTEFELYSPGTDSVSEVIEL